jgi:hypothetical protein
LPCTCARRSPPRRAAPESGGSSLGRAPRLRRETGGCCRAQPIASIHAVVHLLLARTRAARRCTAARSASRARGAHTFVGQVGLLRAARRAAWQRVVTCCSTFGCVATCCATQLLRALRDMALITRPASAANHPTREAAASPLMSTCMACAANFCRGLGPRRARHRRAARESAHIARPRAKAARPRAPRTCAQPARPPAVPFDDVVCAGLARRVCFAAHRSPLAT